MTDTQKELEGEYKKTVDSTEKAFSPISEQYQEDQYGLWQQEVKAWMDLMTLKGLYFNDDWVWILIDRIASKIAAQQLRVMKQTSFIDGEMISEPDEQHPVNAMIEHPNENQTYYEWMYSIIADYGIAGNSLVWKAKLSEQLVHIPIEMTQLDFDRNGKLETYRIIQYNTEYDVPIPREVMSLPKDEIAHMRRPNPSSSLWGLSPFIPGRKSVLFNRYSLEYLNNFYIKGAQPGLVLEMNDVANEKNALRLLRSMEIAHTGRKNQRRNMILPKGVSANTFTQSLSDQQLKDYVNQNRETIINLLQVPKHELSIAETGSLGSEEYKTALRNFWSGPLKSIMKSAEESLTNLMSEDLGDDRWLEFDLTDVEVLQEDLNQKAELSIKLLQTHTLNEVRAKVFDEDPLEGGDETPGTTDPAAAGGFGFFNASPSEQESVNTPSPEPTVETDSTEGTADKVVATSEEEDPNRKVLETNLNILTELKNQNPKWWEEREGTLAEDAEKRLATFHDLVLRLFSDQAEVVMNVVRNDLRSQGFKSIVTKQQFRKTRLRRALLAALSQFEERYINEQIQVLEATVDSGYDASLKLPFNLPNQSEIAAIRAQNNLTRRERLEDRGFKTFSEINNTTTNSIMRIVQEGVENSRTVQEIAGNIASSFTEIENINSRAMTIARTETLTAASIGQFSAMQDASEVIPRLKKLWINAGDDRVRGRNPDDKADHWTLGGEMVDHNDKFSNGLMFPRDPKGPPHETINCRCTFIMVPGDDADSLGISALQSEFDDDLQS